MLFPDPPPSPMPLIIGHLWILSPLDLDVDDVYTAEVNTPGSVQPSISINVTRVTGKRVFVPAGASSAGASGRP